MEIHQLRYFVAVAELGNFTRAAEKCLVSQPSLSQQIIKLEGELGGQLLDRTGRKVQLTDSGRQFYERAVEILTTVETARRELTETADSGRLAVGAIPTVAPYLLPPLLEQFVDEFPKAEVTVFENLTEYTLKSCMEGEIDVGLIALPIEDEQLIVEPLFTEELHVAMSPQHKLATKKRTTFADLNTAQFVLLSDTHCLGELVLSFCKQNACLPVVSCHGVQLSTVQEMVALGRGISLIPQMAVDADTSGCILYRSLAGKRLKRTIAMICRKHCFQSPLVKQFMEIVRCDAKQHRQPKRA